MVCCPEFRTGWYANTIPLKGEILSEFRDGMKLLREKLGLVRILFEESLVIVGDKGCGIFHSSLE